MIAHRDDDRLRHELHQAEIGPMRVAVLAILAALVGAGIGALVYLVTEGWPR